ncbi:MAG: calcium-binding protein [Planctomycetes bacterium]|nr:calcium-binding protein [Planctomycetota bacterium]
MKANGRIHRTLGIEELEARIAPTVDITAGFGAGGAATFTGDQTAVGDNDALVLSVSGGNISHNLLAIGTLAYNSAIDFDPFTAGDQTVAVGAANFTIDLLAGTNSVTLQDGGVSFGTINWTNTGGTNTLAGPNAANVWSITGADAGTLNGSYSFSNVGNLTGGNNTDGFTLSGGTLSGAIDGGAGNDTLTGDNVANTWTITGADQGTATGVTGGFSNVENLTGGTNDDAFTFNAGGSLTGLIDGGADVTGDSVNYSALASPITVTVGTDVVNVETLTGPGAAGDTLVGDNIVNTWSITGADAGTLNGTISFSGFGSLTGGANNDGFTLSGGGTLTGAINGGGGADTLTGDNVANTWTITGADAGTVTGVAGGFTNIANLTGGTNTDAFTLSGGTLTGAIDGGGGGGANTLTGDNVANTWTVTGADQGTVTGVTGGFSNIGNLTGSGSTDDFTLSGGTLSGAINGGAGVNSLTGDNVANTWTITGADAAASPAASPISGT